MSVPYTKKYILEKMIENIDEALRNSMDTDSDGSNHNIDIIFPSVCPNVDCSACTLQLHDKDRMCGRGSMGAMWHKIYYAKVSGNSFVFLCSLIALKSRLEHMYNEL